MVPSFLFASLPPKRSSALERNAFTVGAGSCGVRHMKRTIARLHALFFRCAPSHAPWVRRQRRRSAPSPFSSRTVTRSCREMVARARAQSVSLPGGKVRVRLPHRLQRGWVEGAARRRECGVHTAHTRAPLFTTFDARARDVKSDFLFSTRGGANCCAIAPPPLQDPGEHSGWRGWGL